MKLNTIHHYDFLDNNLPNGCAKLIIADPPYFGTKGEFDFIWPTFQEYLNDVEKWAAECTRLLADNGTLFWWGHALKIAYSQIILDNHLSILNHIKWEKKDAQTKRSCPTALRRFAPVTEHLLMYQKSEQPSASSLLHDDNTLFQPIKKFLDDWLEQSGLSQVEAVRLLGSSATHYLGFSLRTKKQFSLPTAEKWKLMNQVYPTGRSYESLLEEYKKLLSEYEPIKRKYESRRRYFHIDQIITDVINWSQESHLTGKFRHPTQKPPGLTKLLISTTTKEGDLVVIPFSGSGTECLESKRLKRNFVGYEIDYEFALMGLRRIEQVF
jgi:site-specific DNA-methyltransferase (adenine-specific)